MLGDEVRLVVGLPDAISGMTMGSRGITTEGTEITEAMEKRVRIKLRR